MILVSPSLHLFACTVIASMLHTYLPIQCSMIIVSILLWTIILSLSRLLMEVYLFAIIMPRPLPRSRTVTRNDFKNRRLTPQINASFSSMFHLRSHAYLGNFPRGHPSQDYSTASMLSREVLNSELLEKKVHF